MAMEIKKLVRSSYIVNWGLTFALFSAMTIGVYYLANTRDTSARARTMQSYAMDPTPERLKAGETFHVYISTFVHQVCPYEIRWTLINEDHEAVVYIVEPVRQSPSEGLHDIIHDHFIPAHVKPGRYTYEAQIFDICQTGVKTSIQPAPLFVIVH